MARNRYRVTDEKIDLILRLKELCNNQRHIAKVVDLSPGTVSKIINAKLLHPYGRKEETEMKGFFDIDQYAKTLTTI